MFHEALRRGTVLVIPGTVPDAQGHQRLGGTVDDPRVRLEGADAEREADTRPPVSPDDLRPIRFRVHQLRAVLQSIEVPRDPGFD